MTMFKRLSILLLCLLQALYLQAQDVRFIHKDGAEMATMECMVPDAREMPENVKELFETDTRSFILANSSYMASAKVEVSITLLNYYRASISLRCSSVAFRDAATGKEVSYSPATTYPSVPLYDKRRAPTSKENLTAIYNELQHYMKSQCQDLASQLRRQN